jgi:hypothetical protein
MKWKRKLAQEMRERRQLEKLTQAELLKVAEERGLLSRNWDTVVSLDFPHYCVHATTNCGGPKGWCYTFQGYQALQPHAAKVALVDLVASRYPDEFARLVASEVRREVDAGRLPYPNVRLSGSGEIAATHFPAIKSLAEAGVALWGFSRSAQVAEFLSSIGVPVLFSCDASTPPAAMEEARLAKLPLAYTSTGVDDPPPSGAVVTFPVHREGKVREVVDHSTVCPKVLQEFLDGHREAASCQVRCQRCHGPQNWSTFLADAGVTNCP